jgi:hypothetical protein
MGFGGLGFWVFGGTSSSMWGGLGGGWGFGRLGLGVCGLWGLGFWGFGGTSSSMWGFGVSRGWSGGVCLAVFVWLAWKLSGSWHLATTRLVPQPTPTPTPNRTRHQTPSPLPPSRRATPSSAASTRRTPSPTSAPAPAASPPTSRPAVGFLLSGGGGLGVGGGGCNGPDPPQTRAPGDRLESRLGPGSRPPCAHGQPQNAAQQRLSHPTPRGGRPRTPA